MDLEVKGEVRAAQINLGVITRESIQSQEIG